MKKIMLAFLFVTTTANAAGLPVLVPGHYVDGFGGTPYTNVQAAQVQRGSDGILHWDIIAYSKDGIKQGNYLFIWGNTGDLIPPARDYDGDGFDDPTVYRPSDNTWYVLKSDCEYGRWTCYYIFN